MASSTCPPSGYTKIPLTSRPYQEPRLLNLTKNTSPDSSQLRHALIKADLKFFKQGSLSAYRACS